MAEARAPKASWVDALKRTCGANHDLRWNSEVGRWEFLIPCVDGVARSQFFGWFKNPNTGEPIPPDPVTGLPPFRDLTDDVMREVLETLQRTFIGNPWDGPGTARNALKRNQQHNDRLAAAHYKQAGEAFADMVAERGRRLRGAPLIPVSGGGS